jgi:predicted metal-binding membrane protein
MSFRFEKFAAGYLQAWLTFGLPTALGAVFLTDVVTPAVSSYAPVHDGLADAGLFALICSILCAALWHARPEGSEDTPATQ